MTIFNQSRSGKNFHSTTGHEGSDGESRYSSTLSLISALDGGEWLNPHPGRFTPGNEPRYPLYRRLDRPQGRSGQVQKISPPPEFDPRPARPFESLYRLSYRGPLGVKSRVIY
jgi:rRNA maturation protein Nop10